MFSGRLHRVIATSGGMRGRPAGEGRLGCAPIDANFDHDVCWAWALEEGNTLVSLEMPREDVTCPKTSLNRCTASEFPSGRVEVV